MIVIVLRKVPARLRGELTRWMLEVSSGVFVGTVSAVVRDLLWEKCTRRKDVGHCVLAYRAVNEQGFLLRHDGASTRRIVDFDGLQLVALSTARANPSAQQRRGGRQDEDHASERGAETTRSERCSTDDVRMGNAAGNGEGYGSGEGNGDDKNDVARGPAGDGCGNDARADARR